ncbi:pyrroloquinoline quinone biosynthesis peptide chaperone PqqD [Kozakia baliensis]|uniref:Pyrroloquinoline quinone biosynthesis protein PqqD n=1 Tax=Kozakia baliensis TaxID=153496 RepID=A0A1D8UW83_9PROT|nr:pyrroloquinoline quinone biosynthesis peptide chaperone PqqD [Kozakia baliensis]AOX17918.1 pyrroloquinoline quinone biosynthesis protein PqqD [Kozakia baliensis]AOX20798.1 pyrroloquinoline quinone biosynthesis protein PqqD [Kozakia baliensis]GBR26384.1 pyrrolo-quinoline quinone synthesis protein PqqD [Kozakia baliensis NRIC 0488]GEL64372.1 hypothetical protein KBA01_16580 [Kozakia baliensis]
MSIDLAFVPRFARGHRLQHDKVRDVWLIQAPEKAFIADPIAAAVLRLVDGQRPVEAIIEALAQAYQAPRETISHDVVDLLGTLQEQRVLAS